MFDVGANQGDRSALFVSLGAHVIAVEPQSALIDQLRTRFNGNARIVHSAVGSKQGSTTLFLSSEHGLSTVSPEFVQAAKDSPRLSQHEYVGSEIVNVTTLDQLIAEYGQPAFCKIDVEGFELEVLRGLSQPVRSLSFEANPECLNNSLQCVDRLMELGNYRFRFSEGESMTFASEWMSDSGIKNLLMNTEQWGDVYALL